MQGGCGNCLSARGRPCKRARQGTLPCVLLGHIITIAVPLAGAGAAEGSASDDDFQAHWTAASEDGLVAAWNAAKAVTGQQGVSQLAVDVCAALGITAVQVGAMLAGPSTEAPVAKGCTQQHCPAVCLHYGLQVGREVPTWPAGGSVLALTGCLCRASMLL